MGEFACAVGGQCIALTKWQDGIDDCWDASDEGELLMCSVAPDLVLDWVTSMAPIYYGFLS